MMDAAELRLERAAFEQWLQGEGGDNRAELDRLKRALPVVLAECVTETQRQYILHYFVDRMTQKQIGERYGKNPATVSRTIHRGWIGCTDTCGLCRRRLFSPLTDAVI